MPGTLTSHPDAQSTTITLIAYDEEQLVEKRPATVEELVKILKSLDKSVVKWVDVTGLGNVKMLKQVGDEFGLHILALEDVVNVHQRAKLDNYSDHLFTVARYVTVENHHVRTEQISFFLADKIVISIQERLGDCFEQVRTRLRMKRGRIRSLSADYLLYALVDAIIDSYFPVVDEFADRLDSLEDAVMHGASGEVLDEIHEVRTDLLVLRRALRPHRDSINGLCRDSDDLVHADTALFLRDCNDHISQLTELIELYRETCTGLREHHLSMVSTRMNEVMKVLTIISTIFIPLGFIAGLYGMNFNTDLPGNLPELNRPYAYVITLGGMGAIAVGMMGYFWRKGWIFSD